MFDVNKYLPYNFIFHFYAGQANCCIMQRPFEVKKVHIRKLKTND